MNILITGNLGYIGTELTTYLKKKNSSFNLIGFDSGFFKNDLTYLKKKNFINVDKQIFKDIRNVNNNDLKNIDIIIHLAALSNDPIGKKYSRLTKKINLQSSKKIYNLALKSNVKKFIFASSCSVYGLGGSKSKTEKSRLLPLTDYAQSKINFEKFVLKKKKKIQFTALRYSTACGASSRLRLDLVLNDFVASAVLKNKIELLSKGDAWRPLIDVSDMCRSIDWAINRKKKKNIVVNVGKNSHNIKILDLAKMVKKHFPKLNIDVNHLAKSDKRSYKVDFSLYKKLAPKHQPIKNLDQTIKELKSQIKKQKIKKNFRNSNYIRLNKLAILQKEKKINKNLIWN